MTLTDWLVLFVFIVLSQGAGLLGSLAMNAASATWYASLALPALTPPTWLFGPAWTFLYVLMGVAAFIVWRLRERSGTELALVLFVVQLVLNALWSVIFFGMQSALLGLIEIGLLWLAIVATIAAFAHVSKVAAWLLAPYLLWVTFAAYLTFEIWRLNG